MNRGGNSRGGSRGGGAVSRGGRGGGSRGGIRGGSRGGSFGRGGRGGAPASSSKGFKQERLERRDQMEEAKSSIGYHGYMNEDSDDERGDIESLARPNKRDEEFIDEELSENELYGSDGESTDDDMDEDGSLFSNRKDRKLNFEDEDGDGFIDLSDLLDGGPIVKKSSKSSSSKQQQQQQQKQQVKKPIYEEDEDEDEDEEDDDVEDDEDEEEEMDSEEDDDDDEEDSYNPDEDEDEDDQKEDDEENNNKMMELMEGLDTKQLKKLTNLPDVTELFSKESQYGVRPSNDDQLDLGELLELMPEGFETLKTQIQGVTKGGALSTPLNQVDQAKLSRKIATEDVQRSLAKWDSFIRHQRELATVVYKRRVETTNDISVMGTTNSNNTELNKLIGSALKQDGLKNVMAFQSAATKKKSANEVKEEKERLREIISLRNKMYYEAQKNKRQSKIKSKTYRKILKKQRMKDMEKRDEELSKIDPEYARQKQLAAEEARLIERMSQRHTNKSKFMKNVLKGGLNTERRQAINEHNQIAQNIKNKMMKVDKDYDEMDSGSDSESNQTKNTVVDDDEQMYKSVKRDITKRDVEDLDSALPIKERIQQKLGLLGMNPNAKEIVSEKGINALKFMQTSLERDLDERIQNKIRGDNGGDDYDKMEAAEREKEYSSHIAIHRPVAKQQQQQQQSESHLTNQLVDKVAFSSGHKMKTSSTISVGETPSVQIENVKSNDNGTTPKSKVADFVKMKIDNKQTSTPAEEESNPWLQGTERVQAGSGSKEKKKASHQLMIDMDKVMEEAQKSGNLEINDQDTNKQEKKKNTNANNKRKHQSMSLITSKKQKDLLKKAFENDGIQEEFQQEKEELIEGAVEAIQESIPGWGSWAGEGIRERRIDIERRQMKKIKRDAQVKELASQRLDIHNQKVIIDDQALKGGVGKYMINNIPRHYMNKEQYENTLETPVGPDFNTYSAFKKLIEPKLRVESGVNIQPVNSRDLSQFKKEAFKKKKMAEEKESVKRLNQLAPKQQIKNDQKKLKKLESDLLKKKKEIN